MRKMKCPYIQWTQNYTLLAALDITYSPIQEDEEKDEMNTHFDHVISHISFELMSVVDFSWII